MSIDLARASLPGLFASNGHIVRVSTRDIDIGDTTRRGMSRIEYLRTGEGLSQIPTSMIAFARMGTVWLFNPAIFIRLSPTM